MPRQYTRTPNEVRFWSRVDKTEGCWLFTGDKHHFGYGSFPMPKSGSGAWTHVLAHRFSWELHNDAIPAGLFVLHRCDTPACVRPDHLFLGTRRDNTHDMMAKGRQAVGTHKCNAKLTEEDIPRIRQLVAAGRSQASVAREYRVSHGIINEIVSRKRWKHVA
jgi:hypothetical protein